MTTTVALFSALLEFRTDRNRKIWAQSDLEYVFNWMNLVWERKFRTDGPLLTVLQPDHIIECHRHEYRKKYTIFLNEMNIISIEL